MVIDGTKIFLTKGNTGVVNVSCTNEADVPIPLVVGDKVYLTVIKSLKDSTEIFQKTIETFDDGVACIVILPTDTKVLDPGKYIYDIQVHFADGTIENIVDPSEFIVGPVVTNE